MKYVLALVLLLITLPANAQYSCQGFIVCPTVAEGWTPVCSCEMNSNTTYIYPSYDVNSDGSVTVTTSGTSSNPTCPRLRDPVFDSGGHLRCALHGSLTDPVQ
jgi:hypothetical protein